MQEAKKHFRMRNDVEGASFAAFFTTMTVCSRATSLGYEAQFLPLEPRNQREARSRPDTANWKNAEMKEQDMLWGKGTFQLVDRPSDYEYDPIPLQFVYKLKIKDGDYEHGVPKARLVLMGNLQYEYEYGDTYAPTARLWVIRTMHNRPLKRPGILDAFALSLCRFFSSLRSFRSPSSTARLCLENG